MISTIKVDLEDNGLGGVHHRTLRSLGWLNYKTSNGSKLKRCQHEKSSREEPAMALPGHTNCCLYQLAP